MQRLLKNLDYATALPLAAQVDCQPGQVASKTLVQNDAVGITLFAFDKGEKISAHTSTGDAFVLALEGQGQVTINGQTSPSRPASLRYDGMRIDFRTVGGSGLIIQWPVSFRPD